MFQIAKEVLKELLIFLVMVQVVWFLVPRSLKKLILGTIKVLSKGYKGTSYHVKECVNKNLKQRKKVTPVDLEQPHGNVIKVIYPNRCVKKYYKVN